MKMKLFIAIFAFALVASCNDKKKHPTTDIDVARAFIKDILENNYKDAQTFVLNEDMNNQYFDLSKKEFESKSKEELKLYKDADIIVNEIKNLSDSVTVVNFSNTYKRNIKNEVKVVKVNGEWFVDLKHTFQQTLNVK